MTDEKPKTWRPTAFRGIECAAQDVPTFLRVADAVRSFEGPRLFDRAYCGATFLLLMMIDGGWTDGGLEWIASHLGRASVDVHGNLAFQIDVEDVGTKHVSITMPPLAKLVLLARTLHSRGLTVANALGLPESGLDRVQLEKRLVRVQEVLGVSDPISMQSLYAITRTLNLDLLPNLASTLMSIAPGAQHAAAFAPLVGSDFVSEVLAAETFFDQVRVEPVPERAIAPPSPPGELREAPEEWARIAKQVVERFFDRLHEIEPPLIKDPEQRRAVARRATALAIEELGEHGFPETSSAALAVRWAAKRFLSRKNPLVETVRSYVGVIFTAGLFRADDAYDLIDWDSEDWAEFAQSVMDRAHTQDTKISHHALLREFLTFASRQFGFSAPDVNGQLDPRPESIRRSLVGLGPV